MSKIALDHIGIAVESMAEGRKFYETLGLVQEHSETVESEKVNVGFFPLSNGANIELLEATEEGSAVAKFIKSRGTGIHHICLRVENIEEHLKQLKAAGVRLIHEEPKMGAHNCKIAFVHPKSTGGVLIELSEPQEQK